MDREGESSGNSDPLLPDNSLLYWAFLAFALGLVCPTSLAGEASETKMGKIFAACPEQFLSVH
jgi:hypothetical protein